ncbi:MAG: HAD-IB family phosphatase, partial [Planctomycetota bacterium]
MSAPLRSARAEPPYDAIVFDCDSTLSWIEGIEDLQRDRADVRDEVARLTGEAMAGAIPLEEAYGRRLELIAPTLDEVNAVGRRYVETLVEGAADVVRGLRLLGKDVGIVSGGLLPPVRALGHHLGVPDERIFAVGIEFDGDGAYAGFDAASPLARAGGKPEVIAARFGHGTSALIGDGATDLEAASACDRFIAFAGVAERGAVVDGADRAIFAPDLAAVLPHVLTGDELVELRSLGDSTLARLVERALRPRLWIPGPTEVRGEILRSQSTPMMGHRSSAAKEVIHALNEPLRRAFGLEGATRHEVAVHSCTATGLMEMSVRALEPGSRVLSLVNGAFSERYAAIAESIGCDVARIESSAGEPANLDAAAEAVARAQRLGRSFRAVTVTLSETSTGALTEPSEIAAALSWRGSAMLFADAVTYLGAAPLDMARHGIDFALAGTQKALALPPGLGLFGVSHRFLESARAAGSRGFFLDLVRITEAHLA